MRRVPLVVALGAAVVALLTSAAGATAKSATFKTGTYKLKPAGYTVTLKHARCGGKLQLCVALPTSPKITCTGPANEPVRVGNFATPVALPSSGKVTEHAPITRTSPIPGAPAETGQSAFSVAFKKNGTASGYVEVSLVALVGGHSIPCSGRVSFTAKLA
ncbi:MAG: hypothetical protein JWO23_2224 [Solirubrobacterales bacterium]|jgi:hypothetical protein|nr:hypothetical protein [Solirubrobacterales bacterium]